MLHIACRKGYIEIVKYFLSCNDIDVNIIDVLKLK